MKHANQMHTDHQPAPKRTSKRNELLAQQLRAYAAAHKEAIKNGTPRPHISDFVTEVK